MTSGINVARRLALYVCAAFLPLFLGPIQIATLLLLALLSVARMAGGPPLARRELDAAAALYVAAIAASVVGPGRMPIQDLALALWPMVLWACTAQLDWPRLAFLESAPHALQINSLFEAQAALLILKSMAGEESPFIDESSDACARGLIHTQYHCVTRELIARHSSRFLLGSDT